MKDIKVQDAIENSWVDRVAPLAWRPFLRLSRFDRPVGAWLLFLPCVFAALLAGISADAALFKLLHVIIVCAIGAWLMRGAGCTWNDIVDRDFDAQVARTRSRPIPSGQVSVKAAAVWMAAQALVSFFALLTFSWPTIWLAISSLLIVAAYPFAKRVTHWPQIVLGLAFNWGVLVAWMEIYGALPLSAILFYLAMIFWTLFYDSIYAFQDIEDDVLVGVKSSAQAIAQNPERALSIMLGVMMALIILSMLVLPEAGGIWLRMGLLLAAFLFFALERGLLKRFRANDPRQSLILFRRNVSTGQIYALVLSLIYLIAPFLAQ